MMAKRFLCLFSASFGGILLSALLMFSLPTLPSKGQEESLDNGTLEIYSWWSWGADIDALNTLIDVYTSTYTSTNVIVSFDYTELRNRMTTGNPPDSFHYHCGSELFHTWVDPGDHIEPVTQLWSAQGWMNEFPQDLIDLLTHRGELYCVPLNIHRGNVVWYNKQVFSDAALTAPTTIAEFFTVAEGLEAAGKIPLALGDNGRWASIHLMETVLLGSMGPEKYRGLWNGTTLFNGPEVIEALEAFDHMMDYVNSDYSALSWDQAVQLVANGQAGMTIMGDWAEGYLESMGLTPDVDFGWVPVPGSAGSFMVINDSFVMARNAPHAKNAANWLETVGSLEGQDAFSHVKSSIPARLDADLSLYGVYHQSVITDYVEDELAPSLVHGMAAPPAFTDASRDIVDNLIVDGDAETAANAWQQAACEAGFGECFAPIIPTEPSTLVYTDTRGITTTIEVPAGAVTETTTLGYVPVETVTATLGFAFAGHAFNLNAYQGGSLLPGFTFSVPVTITIHYDQSDLNGLDEITLMLGYWSENAGDWVDAASTCTPTSTYERHPNEDWLAVPICHLSRFAMFGNHKVYLPQVFKTSR